MTDRSFDFERLDHPTRFEKFAFTLCDVNAAMSKDPSSRIGAVLMRPNRTVHSMGWNSFPRHTCDHNHFYDDRSKKYSRVVHAERNAILSGCLITSGLTLYVTRFFPCSICAGDLLQIGIGDVVVGVLKDETFPERWMESFLESKEMFDEARVPYRFVKWADSQKRESFMNMLGFFDDSVVSYADGS